jgi:hypothetical protein
MIANIFQPAADGGGILDKITGILNSPGGAAAIGAGGAALQAYGQNKQHEADRATTARQFAANMAQRQMEGDRQHQLSQASASTAASPLGAEQSFAQKQAILGSLLGNTRNFSATPGDPRVAAAMGSTNQGGMRMPEGGFDPAMLQRLFGDKATMESLANRQQMVGQLNPRSAPLNLGTMFGDAGSAASQGVMSANQSELDRQLAESARQRELIQRAIDEDIRGEKQGKKNKAGGALSGAASGAATGASLGSIIPGIGTGIGAAIGGIGGFLKGLF